MYKEIKQKTSSCSNIHEVLETILWGFLTRDRIRIRVIQFRMMQLVKKIPRSNQLICLVEGIIEDLGADTGFRRGGGRDGHGHGLGQGHEHRHRYEHGSEHESPTWRLLGSVVEPEPPFLAGALKKGAAPALQLKLQL